MISSSRIQALISSPRFHPYRDASADLDAAVELYEWNARVSSEMFAMIGYMEIILRNAIDRELRGSALAAAGGSWLGDTTILQVRERKTIGEATARRRSNGKSVGHDDLVSEMSFGFWYLLLTRRYESTLWTPYLRHSFPNSSGKRRRVETTVRKLKFLRNRIAHHEPLIYRNLAKDRDECLRVIAWVDQGARAWVKSRTDTAAEVIVGRP